MLWTGLAIRCQLRRPLPSLYIRNVPVVTTLFTLTGASRSLQEVSTSQSTGDESVTRADTFLLEMTETLVEPSNSLSPGLEIPQRKKCRRPRSRSKSKRLFSDDSILEHLKTGRQRIKPLYPRIAVAHSWNSRQVWKTNPAYREHVRDKLGPLQTLARTNSPTLAWDAYRDAVNQSIHVPTATLDRLFGVIIKTYAPTRKTFLRLHEITSHLRNQGRDLKLWQWNALIYHSALALRKVHTKDYQAALDVYGEMISTQGTNRYGQRCKPDISTYTTMIYIAIRTGVIENVRHAYSLLYASRIIPDHQARLAILPYYIHTKKLKLVRGLAHDFAEKRQDIGLDGINAYMWAFGKHGYLDVMEEAYQMLRLNIRHDMLESLLAQQRCSDGVSFEPRSSTTEASTTVSLKNSQSVTRRQRHSERGEIDDTLAVLNWPPALSPAVATSAAETNIESASTHEPVTSPWGNSHQLVNGSLAIWNHHTPNHITYAICIQVYAFHGNYRRALQIFREMITANGAEGSQTLVETPYKAIHKVYRALFMGFSRHTRKFNPLDEDKAKLPPPDEGERAWISNALEVALMGFLNMDPSQGRPNDRTVLWIMHAFCNISRNDGDRLVEVWRLLEQRFGTLHVPYSFRQVAKAARKDET